MNLVVDAGFEPATYRLSSECSTTELIDHHLLVIEYPPTNSPVFRITKDQRALPLINRTIPCCQYLQTDIGAV